MIELNGAQAALPDDATVADIVAHTGATPDGRGVAVAVDGEVVPRGAWATTPVPPGARVEVLTAVQGG